MCDESKTNCLLELEQVLTIGAHTLRVTRTELTKSDFDSFTLLVEASGDLALANSLFDGTASVRGQQLKCRYDGTIAMATLEMLTNREFGLSHQHQILHFVCAEIEAEEQAGDMYEFLVPFGYFGQGDYSISIKKDNGGFQQTFDHIKIQLEGVEWILRHLIEIGGVFYTADEAIRVQREAGLLNFNLDASAHIAIQVKTSEIDRTAAEATASDICWLLHLAFAQRVAWAELRVRSGRDARFLCRRAFAFPKKTSGSKPIRNWGDGLIKSFIENAWPIYQKDPQWWKISLNWFSIATENVALESSSMIFCMLFDRLSSHLLDGYKFSKQISDELTASLSDKAIREDLQRRLGELLVEYAGKDKWSTERSGSLVQQIEFWNNTPSYPKKVAIAFELAGLKAPSGKLLSQRHQLMHEGGLKLEQKKAFEFLFDLRQSIIALMLSMLGYRGKFFSLGRGEIQISELMLKEPDPPASQNS